MKKLINILLISIAISFTSCSLFVDRVNYTKEDLEYYKVYNIKDSLIFQSLSTQKRDTSIFISKRIYVDADWFRNVNHQIMVVRYTNNVFIKPKAPSYHENYQNMFSDFSPYHNKNIKFSCTYLNSRFICNENTEVVNKITLIQPNKSFSNVYELIYKRAKFHNGTNKDPAILYWDKKYGIIKYITFEGEIWERINWNKATN